VVELLIRVAAHGDRPGQFLRSSWNVFDFVVVTASFVPGIGQNATLLRVVRLARIVRLVSLLPDLRVLLLAVGRSIPPVLSLVVATVLMVYIYGMVGWLLFGDELPKQWGDIDTSMLTLGKLLTLENFPDYVEAGMNVHPWTWVYFFSYALLASFLLLNLLIGIVINSLEEARAIEHREEREERRAAEAAAVEAEEHEEAIERRITALRDALEDLEIEIAAGNGAAPRIKH
jgi:voltage-gated sodium channel